MPTARALTLMSIIKFPRTLARIVLGVFIVLAACKKPSPSTTTDAAALSAYPTPLARVTAMRAHYRLAVDARFLAAASNIHHVLTGEPEKATTASWVDGRGFVLVRDSTEVGVLPELADYPTATKVLGDWAETVAKTKPKDLGPAPTNAAAIPFDDAAFTVLARADAEYAKAPTAQALHDAALALASIALTSPDGFDLLDSTRGAALALAVLDDRLAHGADPRIATLVALALGYRESARGFAAQLAVGDALRARVEGDDATLARVAAGPEMFPRYLQLVRLHEQRAASRDDYRRTAFNGVQTSLATLSARMTSPTFEDYRELAAALPPIVLMQTYRLAGDARGGDAVGVLPPRASKEGAFSGVAEPIFAKLSCADVRALVCFQNVLAKLPGTDGAFAAKTRRREVLHAAMVAAMRQRVWFDLEYFAAVPVQFARDFVVSADAVDGAFERWMRILVADRGGGAVDDVAVHVGDETPLGGTSRIALFDRYVERRHGTDFSEPSVAQAIASRLDSRVTHRATLARVAYETLADVRLAEQLYDSALSLDRVGQPDVERWLAEQRRDEPTLRSILADARFDPVAKARAIDALEEAGSFTPTDANAAYETLVAKGASYPTCEQVQKQLERKKRYPEAFRAIDAWRTAHPKDTTMIGIYAATAAARMLFRQEKYADALATVAPYAPSYQAGAMQRTALSLAALGRAVEAREWASKARVRYPNDASVAIVAEVEWRLGDDKAAAAAVPKKLSDRALVDLAEAFADVFPSARPDPKPAFDALVTAGLDVRSLNTIITTLHRRDSKEQAFVLQNAIATRALSPVQVYVYRRDARGESDARAWLATALPAGKRGGANWDVALFYGADELAWDFLEDPVATTPNDDCAWLERLIMTYRADPTNAVHLAKARSFFSADPKGRSHYFVAGRYLLGIDSVDALDALGVDQKKVCEIAYYLGIKAQVEGRHADASDLFHVSVETGLLNVSEYQWATQQVYFYRFTNQALSKLPPGARRPR